MGAMDAEEYKSVCRPVFRIILLACHQLLFSSFNL